MASVSSGKVMHLHVFTTTERNAVTATEGMLIFNTTTNKVEVYNGTSWVALH
jgi:hypothetical protein